MSHPALSVQPALRDHWQWLPQWAEDRPCLLWYLTFESEPDLSRQAEQVQAHLRDVSRVDVVPLPWLHLTLDDVGFVDELTSDQITTVVRAAREAVAGWVPPAMTLGPVSAMEDAVVLAAGPAPGLRDLRDRLRQATTQVLGPVALSVLDEFWPHVTLAYLNDACEPAEVLDPLAPVSGARVALAAPRLTLASVTRRDRHYQWTALVQLGLGD